MLVDNTKHAKITLILMDNTKHAKITLILMDNTKHAKITLILMDNTKHTKTFRRTLTASVDSCVEIKSAPSVA